MNDDSINKEKLLRDLKNSAQGLLKFAVWFAVPYVILLQLVNNMGFVR